MKKIILCLLSLSCLFSMAGCVDLGPASSPQPVNYMINVTPDTTAPTVHRHAAKDVTVQVNKGYALPGYDSNKMIYTIGNDPQIRTYAYHFWVAPPIAMIAPVISQALSDSQAFKAVVNAPFYDGGADYQVNLQLVKLQQQIVDNKSQVILIINMMLFEQSKHKLIASKRFEARADAKVDAPGAVAGADQALAKLLPAMTNFVIENT